MPQGKTEIALRETTIYFFFGAIEGAA